MLCFMNYFYYTLIIWNEVGMNYLSIDTIVCPYLKRLRRINNIVEYVSNDNSAR